MLGLLFSHQLFGYVRKNLNLGYYLAEIYYRYLVWRFYRKCEDRLLIFRSSSSTSSSTSTSTSTSTCKKTSVTHDERNPTDSVRKKTVMLFEPSGRQKSSGKRGSSVASEMNVSTLFPSAFAHVPEELVLHILQQQDVLSFENLCILSCVSKDWNRVASDCTMWESKLPIILRNLRNSPVLTAPFAGSLIGKPFFAYMQLVIRSIVGFRSGGWFVDESTPIRIVPTQGIYELYLIAIAADDYALIEWMKSLFRFENRSLISTAVREACSSSSMLTCEKLLSLYSCNLTSEAFIEAAEAGNEMVCEWLYSHQCPWDERVCASVARCKHFSLFKTLREWGAPWDATSANAIAGTKPEQIELLEWMFLHDCPMNNSTCAIAAAKGTSEVVKLLHSHGVPWDHFTFANASAIGDISLLKYLFLNSCPCDSSAIANAARTGNRLALLFLYAHGAEFDWSCCSNLAGIGDLSMLKFVRGLGFKWNVLACEAARISGRKEVLKYLYLNNCPWRR